MKDAPSVALMHREPEECRVDIENPSWEAVAEALGEFGSGPARRVELYDGDWQTVMCIEGAAGAFHVSVQMGEVQYYCLRGQDAETDKVVDLGPFAFTGAEVVRSLPIVQAAARAFWLGQWQPAEGWNEYQAGNCLSPLNSSMAKAAAEVGAMWQSFQAGNRGGDATLRVRGQWKASPATRADMKVLARWLELTKLTVVDADGSVHTFEGTQLLPVGVGGKRWM